MFKRASNFFRKTVTRATPLARIFDPGPRFRPSHVKPPGAGGTPFGGNPGHSGVTGSRAPHDLRRARTPADPIRPPHTRIGTDGAHLAPRRRAERNGRGRRLRVRLHGPGRRRPHRGGRGGRRGGRRRREHHPVPGPGPDPALPADTHTDPAAPQAPSTAEAEADTTPSAHPRSEARTAATNSASASATATATASAPTEAETPAAAAGPRRGTETHAEAPADPERAPHSAAGSGQLSGVPHAAPQAPAPRRSVAGLVHPAHHRARGARRRGTAPALTPGGTLCRIGLFSPSRWRPRASWSSS